MMVDSSCVLPESLPPLLQQKDYSMKTTSLLFIMLILLPLPSMVQADHHEDRFANTPNLKTDPEMEQATGVPPTCFGVCTAKITEICQEEIKEYQKIADENSPSAILYDASLCQQYCLAEWNDDVLRCMDKATKCSSLTWAEPYCEEETDSIYEEEQAEEPDPNCAAACQKYRVCALKAGGASVDDGNSAYDTCFEECRNWSPETIRCITNTNTGTGMGCYQLTGCAMKEYGKMIRMMQNGMQMGQ